MAAEYEAGGLSQEAFCQQQDVGLKSLARYLARYRKQKAGNESPRWVKAEVARERVTGELTVLVRGGRRIEVGRGFDAGTLRHLLAVLEQG